MSRSESKNLISGRGRTGRFFSLFILPPLFWAPFVFLSAWSYYSHLAAGALSFEKLWLRLGRWLGSFFTLGLCPLSEALPFILDHLQALILVDLFLALLSFAFFRRGNFEGVEHGSAHWARGRELRPFRQAGHNQPLGHRIYLNLKAGLLNGNVYLQGLSGAGKTFSVIIPGIEAQSRKGPGQGSFIATDVKGALYRDTSKMVRERGLPTYLLNLADPFFSNCYSPLDNVHEERKNVEIGALAQAFVKNVRDEEGGVGDSIWEETFEALLSCCWFYQYDFKINPLNGEPESRALWRTAELIRGIQLDGKSGMISPDCELYKLMQAVKYADPLHLSASNFEFIMTKAMRETIASVLFTAGAKIRIFGYPEIQTLTMKNEIPLDEFCEKPSAIYLNYQIGSPFRVIAALFIEQLFASAYYVAETKHAGKLPINVKLFLDELPSICRVYTLPMRASTVRSYNMDLFITSQSRQQLATIFKNQDKTLLNNCATHIYLGTREEDGLKEISAALGETTTVDVNYSHNSGKAGGGSESTRSTGRKLAMPSELISMGDQFEVIIMQNHPPIFCQKHKTKRTSYYKLLGGPGCPENNRVIEEDLFALSQLHRAEYEALRNARLKPKSRV